MRSTGTLLKFSEGWLKDCDNNDGGCNGGLMDNAFEWCMQYGAVQLSYYSYSDSPGVCNPVQWAAHTLLEWRCRSYSDVQSLDQGSMLSALQMMPVAIAVEADTSPFQLYKTGIITTANCGTNLDHGVLAVGYGNDANAGYYLIVRNSWGADWGDEGYLRIAMRNNTCGCLSQPSYVEMD